MLEKTLVRHKMTDLHYGGRVLDFWFLAHEQTGEPVHEICGYALISRINGAHKTLGTSRTYVQHLKQFWEDVVLWNGLDWREISDEDISSYLHDHRFKAKGLSGKTIQGQLAAISEFYKWAYKYGLLEYPKEIEIGFDFPELLDAMTYAKKEMLIQSQFIPKDEFNQLVECIDRKSRYLSIRDELALLLGYECGTRTSELTNQHNFKIKQIKALLKEAEAKGESTFDLKIYGKGNNKERTILITTRVFNKLKIFLRDKKLRGKFSDDLPLFLDEKGKPIVSPDYGSGVFARARNRMPYSNKEWDNKVYHSLRHSFATNLACWCYENNKSWQSVIPPRMGHNDWQTSLIYVEADALLNNRIDFLEKIKSKGQLKRYVRGK